MRSFVLGRAAAVVAVAALAAAGCSSGGSTAGGSGGTSAGAGSGAGGPGGSAGLGGPGGGKTFHEQVAPGFSPAAQWTVDVPWAADGFKSTYGQTNKVSGNGVVADQGTYGVARVVGGTVVVPSFASGGAAGAVVTTLQFLDAKTGKQIATKALPVGSFLGLTADTAAGQPVVVARYETSQGSSTAATTVAFSASGAQVWSSDGQQVSNGQWSAGLVQDGNKAPLFVGGYTLRLNAGSDTAEHSDYSYDVLDSTGKSVLHVPSAADQWDHNDVSLAGGFAVVSYDDSLTQSDTSHGHEHFTVYDLAAGGKKVADVAEADSGGLAGAAAVTSLGGKVLVAWTGPVTGGFSLPPTDVAVIDTGTGTASSPATLPGGGDVSDLGALVDPASSDAVVYDASTHPTGQSVVVSMSQGNVLWTQQDNKGSLIPLSLHGNTLYGVESDGVDSGGHQLAVKEADGTPAAADYELAPLAFTGDGSPVFVEAQDGATGITVGVGRAG